KNPRYADNRLGCGDLIIWCFAVSISFIFCCAGLPHNINTTLLKFSETVLMTSSVKVSHPISLCECASPCRTVKTQCNNKTPPLAQSCKCGDFLTQPISSSSSLYMFLNEGGNLAFGCTENAKPCA